MPKYGEEFRKFFKQSNSPVFKTLAEIMTIGPTVKEGLHQALNNKQAHMGGKRSLQQKIAEQFTLQDGSSSLYLGQESVFPGPSGWPIPHDAPYKTQLDRCIMAAVEAGLYEKWSDDMIIHTRRESQRQQRELLAERKLEEERADSARDRSLTIIHLQGPFILLFLGLGLAGLSFVVELIIISFLPQ
ncbi:Ionotropic receptor 21a-like 4 [Homarus americanus]|uniref:Ionotropic receptor 21a-like 4 n=2 Tax=Homarus americanus TaxID=6706 RepID=A0A8J5JSQ1_HOMAM|nr:Ionotropic receptor 21a-like 4 [Homarus americanus]